MTSEFTLAVHGLVFLLHKKDIVTSSQLAENICTNSARVRKVMAKLRQAELVRATEGKGSGYQAIDRTEAITLYEVQQALQENVVEANWHSGSMDMDCLIASGMGNIMDQIYGEMNMMCLEYLKHVTIGQIQDQIFGEKKRGLYEKI